MAHGFSGSTVIDRPIDQVFATLSNGTNDPKFSPRVQAIRKTTNGPIGVGTVFESTVKDAGMKSSRSFELTTSRCRRGSAGPNDPRTWSPSPMAGMT